MTHAAGSPDFDTLGAFLEGTLEPPQRARVEEHLSQCRECRATVALFASARAAPRRSSRAATWLAAAAGLLIATAVGVRVASKEPSPTSAAPAPAEAVATPAAPNAPAGTPAAAAPESPVVAPAPSGAQPAEEPLEIRRSGQKRVRRKTFRLEAGEWVDRDYDPDATLETITVSGAGQRRELLSRIPALAPFASIGDRVLVVYEGKVYRFSSTPQ